MTLQMILIHLLYINKLELNFYQLKNKVIKLLKVYGWLKVKNIYIQDLYCYPYFECNYFTKINLIKRFYSKRFKK